MLTELVENGRKIEGKMQAMLSEIKENVQGTNSDRRKPGLKSMVWTRRKKETSTRKEQRNKNSKNEERLRNPLGHL